MSICHPNLVEAIENENLAQVVMLLDQEPNLLEADLFSGSRSLHIACWVKHVGIVKALLDRHAEINVQGDLGRTPLHYAVYEGDTDSEPIVEILLKHGADATIRDESGMTPIEYAITEFNEALSGSIELLRKHSGDSDAAS